ARLHVFGRHRAGADTAAARNAAGAVGTDRRDLDVGHLLRAAARPASLGRAGSADRRPRGVLPLRRVRADPDRRRKMAAGDGTARRGAVAPRELPYSQLPIPQHPIPQSEHWELGVGSLGIRYTPPAVSEEERMVFKALAGVLLAVAIAAPASAQG